MLIPDRCSRVTTARKVPLAFCLLSLLAAAFLSCRPQPQPQKTVASTPTPSPAAQLIGPPGFPPAVLGKPYPGTGMVKLLNRKEGWVEIEHGEIKDLMPAMVMEFWVRDPALMKRVRVGDQVDFVVVEDSKGEYLTELKKVATHR